MTSLLIRQAVEADDPAVGDLLVQAFTAQYALKMPDVVMHAERVADLRNQAEKRMSSTVLVAEIDGRLVGTVALYPWGSPRSEAWIEGAADLRLLATDVLYHRKGLSGPLLDHAERLAREWRVPAVCLHVRRGVSGIARLYMARGYVRDPSGDIDHLPQVFLEAYAHRMLN